MRCIVMPYSLTSQDRLFVLTGAGISVESGLATFRGSGGFWNGHRVEDVATPEAWDANPELVWRFYSMRRRDAFRAQPNSGHFALAKIEVQLGGSNFYLCTQNVDDLHERAGSQRIHHMHGTLFQSRCVNCERPFADQSFYESTESLPKCESCGAPVRPHIVWFGEIPLDMNGVYRELDCATALLVGTSGSVYPAAGFVHIANQRRIRTIYVGPEEPLNANAFDEILLGPATQILPTLVPA
jgi:NAD-dependent deacetylase